MRPSDSLRRLVPLVLLAVLGTAAGAEAPSVEVLREAARLGDRGRWEDARATAEAGGEVVADLVRWQALRAEGEWGFLDYAAFVADHPHWPGLDRLRANGERSILPGTAPQAVVAYFGEAPPQTGEGARALAEALTALGRPAEAEAVVVEAWLALPLTDTGQPALLGAHADLLAPHHWARTEGLLWRWRASDAERMLPLLSDEHRALARARIALIRGSGAGAGLVAALPAALRDDPGLAFDRFNHLAEDGDYTEAASILSARSTSAESLGEPARWASWRAQIARWAMREGRPEEAYALAARHHATEGEAYADLEWLAGYLSLRQLGEPARALDHFRATEAAVTGPISVSRAAYWTGRAEEALNRPEAAALAYARAARHQTAFYGLLAAERLGLPLDPALAGEEFGDWRGPASALAQAPMGDLAQAMLLLLAAGERDDALLFALGLARGLDRTGVGQLAALLDEMHEPFLAVRVGKAATEQGLVVPAAVYPLHPLAQGDWPVGADLALSIARRESEFNAGAASPVGAQGLMQLMPATAREVSGWLGLPYAAPRLLDWEYNAQLGTRYLQYLQDSFGTSPVLVAAGYNAGPGRPRQWMALRGDPRDADVDVVDWIEHIPFAETRTYVMRVAESIPAYRARLTGQAGPVAFTALLRGAPPHIRPTARPRAMDGAALALLTPPQGAPQARLSTSEVPPALAAVTPTARLRPLARPAAGG